MNKDIPIENIYFMLSYAFKVLNHDSYRNMAVEKFSNLADMFAAILQKGIESQVKRYLNREYVVEKESLSTLRGKIEISDSINNMSFLNKKLVCSFDEFSVDSYMNRILKSTVSCLLKSKISDKRKKQLKALLAYFSNVNEIDLHNINWKIHYDKNNETYRMLMGICYLFSKGLLQTQSDGKFKIMDFLDEQRMCRLYEKFILEYYRKEHKEFSANSSVIEWQLDDENDVMLPAMQSDIMLSKNNKVLIIDAKYYKQSTQVQYEKHTVHSANLYQIFTYVKNKEAELSEKEHEVSGMLLYAKTLDNHLYPNDYMMSGNKISVRTLDLNCDFSEIRKQLDDICDKFFCK
ncbi:MAG: 5-methylcytosine-specific restriction endonuclease system specificity protein McrC [Spirochaetaceae bacterium]|nr:5-methylcytosine-specific restriction endonuclease system specificity protein McrC [Spirochaetaceae bacterium]